MIVETIVISAIIIMGIRTCIVLFGGVRERSKSMGDCQYQPFVSVIVPARNEENNIKACIESINQNSYPKDNYEIIIINDRSTDRTEEIILAAQNSIPNLVCHTVKNKSQEKNLQGKAGAIQQGMEVAKGEIVLMTDADCEVNKDWIESTTAVFSDNSVSLAMGYTLIKIRNIFDVYQAIEWAYLSVLASAAIGLGFSMGGFGNNMTVRRSVFNKLQGYKNIDFSVTEDLALLQSFFKKKEGVRHIASFSTTVTTLPVTKLKEYFAQRHRWTIGGMAFGWKAMLFIITSLAFWIVLIIALINQEFVLALTIFGGMWLAGIILIIPTLIRLRQNQLIKWVFLSMFIIIGLELLTPFFLLNKKVQWKDQVFKG